MTGIEAFPAFVAGALIAAKSARFIGLAKTTKGQRKVLNILDHEFERAIRPDVSRGVVDRKWRCYAYHPSVGFGTAFSSVAEALNHLSLIDGWLIVVADGSCGIYRPEARWDAQVEIAG